MIGHVSRAVRTSRGGSVPTPCDLLRLPLRRERRVTLWRDPDPLAQAGTRPPAMSSRRIAIACALVCAAVAGGGCAGDDSSDEATARATTTVPQTAQAAKCPFISDYPFWDLPKRMSRPQVEACQTFFARKAPGERCAPALRASRASSAPTCTGAPRTIATASVSGFASRCAGSQSKTDGSPACASAFLRRRLCVP